MGDFELLNFAGPAALAEVAARDWVRELRATSGQEKPYCVALSGGRIARRFFTAVAKQAKEEGVTLNPVHFFWSDERCVPPTDPDSNFALARECLLQPLAVSEGQIHRLRGEEPPELAAVEGEAEIRRFTTPNREGQPVVDVIFLGLGEEGHVASLFPGEPERESASQAVFRPVTSPKPPPRRITIGYPAIAAAQEVWVLASGTGKEKALQESLAPTGRTPLARVLRLRQHTRIFTDVQPA